MKKFIATILSLTMAATCSVGVFADDTLSGDAVAELSVGESSGSGSVKAISTDVYRVVLSTSNDVNYVADPQGLAGLSDEATYSVDQLTGGNVYADSSVEIANRSSKDIVVTATVTATAATATEGNTIALDTFSKVAAEGAAKKIALALVPSEATFTEQDSEAEDFSSDGLETEEYDEDTYYYSVAVDQATTGYELSTDGSVAVPVALAAADYVINIADSSYDIVSGSVGGAVSFAVAGKCTTDYEDWVNLTSSALPTLSVAYTFADYDSETAAYLGTNKFAVDTGNISAKSVSDLAVSATATAAAEEVAISGTITVNGTSTVESTLTVTGLADGETISSVEAVYGTSNTAVGLVNGTHYTLGSEGNTITITAGKGWVTNVCKLSAGDEATLVVTTSVDTYNLTVSVE